MATIVQQTANQSAALNPSLAFTKRVGAGNYLLAVLLVQSGTVPNPPTDNHANVWEYVGGAANNPGTVMLSVFRCRTSISGNTTVSFSTDASSAYAIQEISGVAADVGVPGSDTFAAQPDSFSAAMAASTSHTAQVTPGIANELCEAVICCFGQVTFTNTDASWATAASIANANISMQLLTKVAGPGPVLAHWTTPTNQEVAMMTLSLQ